MTNRERLIRTLKGGIPDCVPVAPDFSNMIPCRLTGKPFWDLYLRYDPPPWEAYIACAKYFNIDSVMDGYFPLTFTDEKTDTRPWENFIVFKNKERIVTQRSYKSNGKRIWHNGVDVYYIADSPTATAMLLDPTHCVRCGLCAARCPTEAVKMESFRFTEEVVFENKS